MSTTTPSLLKRATDILMCLSHGINTATEIANYCSYSVSTVHRLLQSLSELGWVLQDNSSHKYFLGSLISQLAADHASTHRYIVLHSLKEMNRLAEITGETIVLGILEQLHFVRLYDIPSRHSLKITEDNDKLKGHYIGATARVLMSQLPDTELRDLLKHVKHGQNRQDSPNTSETLEQIKEIRRTGYATSFGERIPGSGCVSVPVTGYFCPVALYIVGPENRLRPLVELCIQELKTGAAIISEDLNGVFAN